MPSEAFYQLKEEKKVRLLNAAIEEFSSTPYEKVSVFKIAQSAGISRSGFYYYFKNKEDLYSYIYCAKIKNNFLEYMNSIEEKYDVFRVFQARFDYYLSLKGTEVEPLIKQMIMNIKSKDLVNVITKKVTSLFSGIKDDDAFKDELTENFGSLDDFDTSNLACTSQEDLFMLIILLNTMTLRYVSDYLNDKLSMQEATDQFDRHIKYLKHGFLKD